MADGVILAADVGGTKVNVAVFDEQLRAAQTERFASREHGGLDEILRVFVEKHGVAVRLACAGVAGPVRNGRCQATNLPWVVDERDMAKTLGIPHASLINDLEANAYGIPALAPDDLCLLHPGADDASGNACIIAAGTGLGEAGMYWDGTTHRPYATEGGHCDLSATDQLEDELLGWLRAKYQHVSWERIVCGPGLVNLYRFMRERSRIPEPGWLVEALRDGDPAAAVSKAAIDGTDPVCIDTLDRFVTLYGREAGNLALKTMATGGVFLGGGIAPKILAKLRAGTFLTGFLAKGRMRPVVERMPVRVILNDRTALIGAARCALLRAG